MLFSLDKEILSWKQQKYPSVPTGKKKKSILKIMESQLIQSNQENLDLKQSHEICRDNTVCRDLAVQAQGPSFKVGLGSKHLKSQP